MKYLIILLLTITQVNAQYTNPDDIINFVHDNGFWAITEDTNKLVFCFGINKNNVPACTMIPERYIVIEVPENLQK